jgi:hypothetical protein
LDDELWAIVLRNSGPLAGQIDTNQDDCCSIIPTADPDHELQRFDAGRPQ